MTFEFDTLGDAFKALRADGASMKLSHVSDLKRQMVGKGSQFREALAEARKAVKEAEDKTLKAELRGRIKKMEKIGRDFRGLCKTLIDEKKGDKSTRLTMRLVAAKVRRDKVAARLEKLNAQISKMEARLTS